MESWGEDATGLEFWIKICYSVSVFMTNGFNVIIVLFNVATLRPKLQH